MNSNSDASLEQRLLALSQENERLKSRLSSRSAMDSLLGGGRLPEMPSMPAASATAAAGGVAALYGGAPTSVITSRYGPTPSSCSTTGAALPMLQLAQLQAAIQQQVRLYYSTWISSSRNFTVSSEGTQILKHKTIQTS